MTEREQAKTEDLEVRERRAWFFLGGTATGGICAVLIGFSDQAVPLVSFAGVLAVAVIAAISAEARQGRQLDAERDRLDSQLAAESDRERQRFTHERERLTEELEAENDRQAQRLSHERAIAALDDLRDVIDAASILLRDQNLLATETITAIGLANTLSSEHEQVRRYLEADQLQAMLRCWSRLAVRQGPEAELSKIYSQAIDLHRTIFLGFTESLDNAVTMRGGKSDELFVKAQGLYEFATQFESTAARALSVGRPALLPDAAATDDSPAVLTDPTM